MSKVVSLSEPVVLTDADVKALVEAKIRKDAANKAYDAAVEATKAKQIEAGIKYHVDNVGDVLKTECVRNTFDSKQFAIDHPDLYAQYVKQGNVISVIVTPETKTVLEVEL